MTFIFLKLKFKNFKPVIPPIDKPFNAEFYVQFHEKYEIKPKCSKVFKSDKKNNYCFFFSKNDLALFVPQITKIDPAPFLQRSDKY